MVSDREVKKKFKITSDTVHRGMKKQLPRAIKHRGDEISIPRLVSDNQELERQLKIGRSSIRRENSRNQQIKDAIKHGGIIKG